jgi:hypothetical protein
MKAKMMEKVRAIATECRLFKNIDPEELYMLLKCLEIKGSGFSRNEIIKMAGTRSRE